ncbi:MAG: PfkB family carbohydrate kinase [Deltaproteobacteria bacterium]|nr:PfkB family carbohydrate kinase [Deltaproteobacteria bacterium]
MTSKLLVVGSVAFDTIQTRAGKVEEALGGSATYVSLAASRFAGVNLVGVVGEGDFPQEHVTLLKSRGVDVAGLERAKGRTFRWSGVYADDFSSRTTLDTQLGVFESFDPKIPAPYLDSRYVLLGNIHPALQLKVLDALPRAEFVAADTMNLWINVTRPELERVVSRVHLLVVNDEESFLLTGERQVRLAADRILAMGPSAVIIKRGEHGALLFTRDSVFYTPGLPLPEVVDPTGAGDTFAGGLLGYLAGESAHDVASIRRGMLYGTALASYAVQGFGVTPLTNLTRAQIDSRYDEVRKLTSVEG